MICLILADYLSHTFDVLKSDLRDEEVLLLLLSLERLITNEQTNVFTFFVHLCLSLLYGIKKLYNKIHWLVKYMNYKFLGCRAITRRVKFFLILFIQGKRLFILYNGVQVIVPFMKPKNNVCIKY